VFRIMTPRATAPLLRPLAPALAALALLAAPAPAAGPLPGDRPDPKRIRLEERVEGLALSGDLVLLATSGGLVVVEAAEPGSPRRLGALLLPGGAAAVAPLGQVALVATGSEGLVAADLATPVSPRRLGALDTDGAVLDLAVRDAATVLLADGSLGLKVADLSDPIRPRLLHSLDTGGYLRGLALSGREHALLAAGSAGLLVAELPEKGAPRLVGRLETRDARAVLADCSLAWVADGVGGLLAVDLASLEAPKLRARLELAPFEARDVARVGEHLVVALGRGGLAVVEEKDDELRRVAHLPLSRPAVELAVRGELVLVANDSGGLAVVDLTRPDSPRVLTADPGR
jgi:hypothetical protein